MRRYMVRRLLGVVPLVIGVTTVLFFAVHLSPGDPALLLLPQGASEEAIEQTRAALGLDDPVGIRYVKWVTGMVRGDFGSSYRYRRPAVDVMLTALPNTLALSAAALLLSFLGGVLLGTFQAVRQNSVADSSISVVTLFFYSMPSFWLALMMALLFGAFAQFSDWPIWFPVSGMEPNNADLMSGGARFVSRAHHFVLPVASLSLVMLASVARYMRSSMLDVIRLDFVRTARAKGLPEHAVVYRHALRNALLPIITLLGLYLPALISGTVFIEYVFAWPGVGRLMVNAVFQNDYPVVLATGFFLAMAVLIGSLIADLLYGLVDPRIRHE